MKNITEAATNKLSINNTNSPTTGTVTLTYTDAATTPAAQSVELTLNNARTSGVVLQSATGNTGFESITVTSSGAANSVGTFTAQDVQTLTIKGDKDLSLGTTAPTTWLLDTSDAADEERGCNRVGLGIIQTNYITHIDLAIEETTMNSKPDSTHQL